MTKLRLGPVVDEAPVKVTLELPGPLMRAVTDYTVLHARDTGLAEPLSPARLIVAMLERFIAGDRAFTKARRSLPGDRPGAVAPPRR